MASVLPAAPLAETSEPEWSESRILASLDQLQNIHIQVLPSSLSAIGYGQKTDMRTILASTGPKFYSLPCRAITPTPFFA